MRLLCFKQKLKKTAKTTKKKWKTEDRTKGERETFPRKSPTSTKVGRRQRDGGGFKFAPQIAFTLLVFKFQVVRALLYSLSSFFLPFSY